MESVEETEGGRWRTKRENEQRSAAVATQNNNNNSTAERGCAHGARYPHAHGQQR